MSELSIASPDELRVIEALRAGDENAFRTLVQQHGPAMLRVALSYVRSRAVAEEVVQEAWLGILRGLDRFEGRSSLKTWIFHIVANIARTRAQRESRSVPVSALAGEEEEPAVAVDRFLGADSPWPGHWAAPPKRWDTIPEAQLLSAETLGVIGAAIEALPEIQRLVITMRDVEGWPADEVCSVLELSEANQRVLLHRARSKVRAALEAHLEGEA